MTSSRVKNTFCDVNIGSLVTIFSNADCTTSRRSGEIATSSAGFHHFSARYQQRRGAEPSAVQPHKKIERPDRLLDSYGVENPRITQRDNPPPHAGGLISQEAADFSLWRETDPSFRAVSQDLDACRPLHIPIAEVAHSYHFLLIEPLSNFQDIFPSRIRSHRISTMCADFTARATTLDNESTYELTPPTEPIPGPVSPWSCITEGGSFQESLSSDVAGDGTEQRATFTGPRLVSCV